MNLCHVDLPKLLFSNLRYFAKELGTAQLVVSWE